MDRLKAMRAIRITLREACMTHSCVKSLKMSISLGTIGMISLISLRIGKNTFSRLMWSPKKVNYRYSSSLMTPAFIKYSIATIKIYQLILSIS